MKLENLHGGIGVFLMVALVLASGLLVIDNFSNTVETTDVISNTNAGITLTNASAYTLTGAVDEYGDPFTDAFNSIGPVTKDGAVDLDFRRTSPLMVYGTSGQSDTIDTEYLPIKDDSVRMYNGMVNGLVGYWRFEEATYNGTSGEVIDETGVHNGTSSGTPTNEASGANGDGIYLDGSDDSVNFGSSDDWTLESDDEVTVGFWIKPSDLGVQDFVIDHYSSGASGNGWVIQKTTTDRMIMRFYNTGSSSFVLSEVSSIQQGVWQHVAFTVQPHNTTHNLAYVYINGVENNGAQYIDITKYNPQTRAMVLGVFADGGSQRYNGSFDEFALWRRALSAEEIAVMYSYKDRGETMYEDIHKNRIYSPSYYTVNLTDGDIVFDDAPIESMYADAKAIYHFDEVVGSYNGTAGEVIDAKGVNNGTASGDADPEFTGIIDNRLVLDGAGDAVTVTGTSGEIYNGSGATSMCAWFRAEEQQSAGNVSYILSYPDSANNNRVYVRYSDASNLNIQMGGSSAFNVITDLAIDQWYHFCFTHNGEDSIVYTYVDGEFVTSQAFTNDVSNAVNFYIGSLSGSSDYWNGSIDEVMIFDAQLSADDVKGLYAYGGGLYLSDNVTTPGGNAEWTQYWTMDVADGWTLPTGDYSTDLDAHTVTLTDNEYTGLDWDIDYEYSREQHGNAGRGIIAIGTGMAELPTWFPMMVIVIMASLMLGIVMRMFGKNYGGVL